MTDHTRQFLIHLNAISPLSSQAGDAILNVLYEVNIKKNHDLQVIGQTCKTSLLVCPAPSMNVQLSYGWASSLNNQ